MSKTRILEWFFTIGPRPREYESNEHKLDLHFKHDGTPSGLPLLQNKKGVYMVPLDDYALKLVDKNHQEQLKVETANADAFLSIIKYLVSNKNPTPTEEPIWNFIMDFYGRWYLKKISDKNADKIKEILKQDKDIYDILKLVQSVYEANATPLLYGYIKTYFADIKNNLKSIDFQSNPNVKLSVENHLFETPKINEQVKDAIRKTNNIHTVIDIAYVAADLIVNNLTGNANQKIEWLNGVIWDCGDYAHDFDMPTPFFSIESQDKIDTSIIAKPDYVKDTMMSDFKNIIDIKAHSNSY